MKPKIRIRRKSLMQRIKKLCRAVGAVYEIKDERTIEIIPRNQMQKGYIAAIASQLGAVVIHEDDKLIVICPGEKNGSSYRGG